MFINIRCLFYIMKYQDFSFSELSPKEFSVGLKIGLVNAIKHEGKCRPGTIISGLLGEFDDLRSRLKKAGKDISVLASKINKLSLDEQLMLAESLYPGSLDSPEEKGMFDSLGLPHDGSVITAFPPGPEKYPHIGHAKALFVNHELARSHKGKFFLRFEDTNPRLVKKEFYDAMIEDFKWLGVDWDDVHYASDHFELFYDIFEKMISAGEAYICELSQDEFAEIKDKGGEIPSRSEDAHLQLEKWKLLKRGEIEAVGRLKIDLNHQNSTMRDPVAFRLIKAHSHPMVSKEIVLFPSYDFQNSILDGYYGITHRYRSKEFEMRRELQALIQKRAGFNVTNIREFARFELEGSVNSGREIREKIKSGEISGWDHPSLSTLRALKRRGIASEVIKEFVLKTGLSKNEAKITWNELFILSRRFQDDKAPRRFFVRNPKKVDLKGVSNKVSLRSLPSGDLDRSFALNDHVWLDEQDFNSLKEGFVYRLLGGINCKYVDGSLVYLDENIDTFKEKGEMTIHYVVDGACADANLLMPTGEWLKGKCESNEDIPTGSILQFERLGFVRKDSKTAFWYAHK